MEIKNTLFDIVKGSVTLTLYQLDVISDETKRNPEATATEVLNKAGVSEEYHLEVAELLHNWNMDKGATPKPRTKKGKRNPGDTLSDYLNSLNNTQICFCLANYNPIAAQRIYTQVDFRVTIEAFSTWSQREMVDVRSNFEAVIVGMGGELTESKRDHKVHDGSAIQKGKVISFG